MKKIVKTFLLATMLVTYACTINAQSHTEPLIMGDPAPKIKYSKWVKGTPVEPMKEGHIYVLECWATWCGPCIAAMPHLSELAKKYEGRATFIGMNVWEKIPEDQSYETVIPKVSKFITSLVDKMSYNVAIDDADRYIAKNWLARAKAPGIPTTFVIKDGIFLWMGQPAHLDKILESIEAGTYDLAQYREGHRSGVEASLKMEENDRALRKPIDDALAAKDYKKALALWDTLVVKKPIQKYIANINKFKIILDHIDEKEAIQYSEDWKKRDGERMSVYLAQEIVKEDRYSKETYLYAAQEFEKGAGAGTNVNPMFYDLIATSYYYAKDYDNAVQWQTKAVEAAETAVKDGKFVGIIMDYTVTEYADKLKNYKAESAKVKS